MDIPIGANDPLIAAERLAALMQAVGFAVWQLQELETTLATYCVIRIHAHRGIGHEKTAALISHAEGRSLGSLISELVDKAIIGKETAEPLREILKERNWLTHCARRETRGILADAEQFDVLLRRVEQLSDRALELLKTTSMELETYVVGTGVDRNIIDKESERLMRAWGLASR